MENPLQEANMVVKALYESEVYRLVQENRRKREGEADGR